MEYICKIINNINIDITYKHLYNKLEEEYGCFLVSDIIYEIPFNNDSIVIFNINNLLNNSFNVKNKENYDDIKQYNFIIIKIINNSIFTIAKILNKKIINKTTIHNIFNKANNKNTENIEIIELYNDDEIYILNVLSHIFILNSQGKLINNTHYNIIQNYVKIKYNHTLEQLIQNNTINHIFINNEEINKITKKLIQFRTNNIDYIYIYNIIYINSKEKAIVEEINIIDRIKPINIKISNNNNDNNNNNEIINEILLKIENISIQSRIKKKINIIGYQLLINNQKYVIYTEIYNELIKERKKYKNLQEMYLSLYQQNRIINIVPFITPYVKEIKYRIDTTIKTLAKEILNIYHATRKQKNKDLYEILTDSYKKTIFGLHGMYIDDKIKEINNQEYDYKENKSITVYDVYYYIKCIPYQQIIQMLKDRSIMISYFDHNNKIFNKTCICTLTITKLLFHDS